MAQTYDIIGDIHGYATVLEKLLEKLGYKKSNGAYSHPSRQAVFVGDIIDKGTEIREALFIVRSMVDATDARMRCWEREGKHADVLEALRSRFHRNRAEDNHIFRIEARNVIQRMQECLGDYPTDGFSLADLHYSFESDSTPTPPPTDLRTKLVRILYIGGNETQERYIEPLKKDWQTSWPGLQAEFYLPGWDSGWDVHWDKIGPKIPTFSAIVLSPLVQPNSDGPFVGTAMKTPHGFPVLFGESHQLGGP